MKYFAIILLSLSIGSVVIYDADALIEKLSLEDLIEKAEFVVIGEVTEISPLVTGYLLPFTDGYDRFQLMLHFL